MDYLQIIHQKTNNQMVLLWWVASPMMGDRQTADVLDKYVVLAIVDAHIDPTGTTTYAVGDLTPQDGSGKPLKRIGEADMPPALTATISGLRAMMQQMLGQMGKGMQLIAYEAGDVRPCTKGALSVLYGGETYTYDTPVPGCPAN
jgi:hypothetical protein